VNYNHRLFTAIPPHKSSARPDIGLIFDGLVNKDESRVIRGFSVPKVSRKNKHLCCHASVLNHSQPRLVFHSTLYHTAFSTIASKENTPVHSQVLLLKD